VRKRYFNQISSRSFAKELIRTFQKEAYIPLYWSSSMGNTVGEAFKKNHSGIGNFFEMIFFKVCKRRKIPCKIIQEHDADFIIDGTRFEMKTNKENKGLHFGGSGTTIHNPYKKCGNYIFIGYKLNESMIISNRSWNRGLVTGFFYSINRGIFKNEHWKNNCVTSQGIKLIAPNQLAPKIQKTVVLGNIQTKKKNVKFTTEEIRI